VGGDGSISIIDGKSNNLIAGITFSISPPNAGEIYCNKQRISKNYTEYGIGTAVECEAKANPGFAFSSWSGDITPYSSNISIFDSLFNLLSGYQQSGSMAKFTLTEYGKLNANFIVPVTIPKEYLVTLFGILLSVVIPSTLRWLNGRRQRSCLHKYMSQINEIIFNNSDQSAAESHSLLDHLKRNMTESYTKGEINDSQYKTLNDKISEYNKKL
jgi:hypothetical protein